MKGAGFRSSVYFPLAFLLLLATALASISIGSASIELETVIRVLAGRILPEGWLSLSGITQQDDIIVSQIRTPRAAVAALAGAALAVAGAQLQGLFRNPLAEPNVIGVSAGAALGAVIAFATNLTAHSSFWIPLLSFAGALVALFTVYSIATRGGRTPIATLLLAGIALGALLSALSSLVISLSFVNFQVATEILFWMMGGLDSRRWLHVWICLPFVAVGLMVALWFTRDLDLLLLGEETSASLGVEVETVKRVILVTAALLTGAAVAVSGMVAFVGLVVPHFVRLILGPSHRILIPASALAGAVFLIACDILARTLHPPLEIRLGVITAAFGAPFFLYLLRSRRKEAGYF